MEFGEIDFVKFAESFGAKGLKVNHSGELADALKQALKMEGPVLIEIPVDYADNSKLY